MAREYIAILKVYSQSSLISLLEGSYFYYSFITDLVEILLQLVLLPAALARVIIELFGAEQMMNRKLGHQFPASGSNYGCLLLFLLHLF